MRWKLSLGVLGWLAAIAAPAAAQTANAAPGARLHALVIGVDRYGGTYHSAPFVHRLVDLRGAVNDAVAIAAALSARFGGTGTVHLLLDDGAARDSIDRTVQQIIRAAHEDDTFVFFFAGHGDGSRAPGGPYLILPGSDTTTAGQLITPRMLRNWLNVVPAMNQLVILDAVGGADFFRALQALDVDQRTEEAQSVVANLSAITVDGMAMEIRMPDGSHAGALTYALTRALSDTDNRLMSSVARALENLYDEDRAPLLIHHGGEDFSFAAPPAPATDTRSDRRLAIDTYSLTLGLAVTVENLPADAAVSVNGRAAQVEGQTVRASLPLAEVGAELRVDVQRGDGSVERMIIPLSEMRSVAAAGAAAADLPATAAPRPRSIALLFATNEYDHERNLRNPVFDAEAIGAELEQNYGFEVRLVRNATYREMRDTLDHYAARPDAENDQLLVFFAGHGSYDQRYSMDGYIVARDTRPIAEDRYRETAVLYNWIRRRLANATSRHVLLMLDVCYGGSFIDRISEASMRSGDDDPMYRSVDLDTYLRRTTPRATRRYLTAGGIERVPDGRPGEHSPFARRFLEALRTYGGSRGFLTLADLNAHLQTVDPEPRAGGFERDEPGSDFVFVARQ